VFFTITSSNGPENGQIAALDLQTGSRKTIVRGGTDAAYVDTSAGGAGHLVYASTGTLRAVRFDFHRLTVIGDPMPVVDQVAVMQTGAADFSVSRDGTLIYVPGGPSTVVRPLVWVSRDGHQELVNTPARAYTFARLSPDETRVALAATDQQNDVWIHDLRRGTMTRLTSDPTVDNQPLWSPDGRRIVFASARTGASNLYGQAADGTGAVERLTTSPTPQSIGSFAPDGRSLVFQEGGAVTGSGSADLMLLRFESPLRTEPLLRTPFFEAAADISPDGRWLAYHSTESGRAEVYVRPFPNVSAGGGRFRPPAARGRRGRKPARSSSTSTRRPR
jgi:serine/threonine-protein kinase